MNIGAAALKVNRHAACAVSGSPGRQRDHRAFKAE
jgi:hypothetical protein